MVISYPIDYSLGIKLIDTSMNNSTKMIYHILDCLSNYLKESHRFIWTIIPQSSNRRIYKVG